jgi:hypothetical protein
MPIRLLDAPPAPLAQNLITVTEVARMLGMSSAWVRQHSAGKRQPTIPCLKLGKSVRFRRETVVAFIDSLEKVA